MKTNTFTIGKVFSGIRKGFEFLNKAKKILETIMLIEKHGSALMTDLELIWNSEKPSNTTEQ